MASSSSSSSTSFTSAATTSWTQRLYAFLLRRILGPYLSPSSTAKLHESIQVSFQEGRFAVSNVELNVATLNAKLSSALSSSSSSSLSSSPPPPSSSPPLTIAKARADKLEIVLSLEGGNGTNSNSSSSSKGGGGGIFSSASLLGSAEGGTAASKMSLVAKVIVDGIEVQLAPPAKTATADQTNTPVSTPAVQYTGEQDTATASASTSTSTRAGLLSSYVDAAISSLSLSIQLSNVKIRAMTDQDDVWVEVKLATARYMDAAATKTTTSTTTTISSTRSSSSSTLGGGGGGGGGGSVSQQPTTTSTILNKAIDFSGLSISTGENGVNAGSETNDAASATMGSSSSSSSSTSKKKTMPVLQTHGTGRILLRVMAINQVQLSSTASNSATRSTSEESCGGTNNKNDADVTSNQRIQHDIEVALHQKIHASVDETSIRRIHQVASEFLASSGKNNDGSSTAQGEEKEIEKEEDGLFTDAAEAAANKHHTPASITCDSHDNNDHLEDDLDALSGIMKQFAEAQKLAKAHPVTGGILLPNDDDDDNHGNRNKHDPNNITSFDAFFDANDQSFGYYQSVISSVVAEQQTSQNLIHTRLKFYLREGGIKLRFAPAPSCLGEAEQQQKQQQQQRVQEDYMLLSFGDLNISSSLSQSDTDIAISLLHLELEDSIHGESPKIASLVRFTEEASSNMDRSDIISRAPCVSLRVARKRNQQADTLRIDFSLLPMELSLRQQTISKSTVFVENVKSKYGNLAENAAKPTSDVTTSDLNEGSPYLIDINGSCSSLSVLLPLEGVSLSRRDLEMLYNRCGEPVRNVPGSTKTWVAVVLEDVSISGFTGSSEIDEGKKREMGISCYNFIVSIISNSKNSFGRQQARRLDLFCCSSRRHIDSSSAVSVKFKSLEPATESISQNEKEDAQACGFPLVQQLSAVKATQEEDADEMDAAFGNQYGMDGTRIRGVDPQSAMIAAAKKSTAVIQIHLPILHCDLTKDEIDVLIDLLPVSNGPTNSEKRKMPPMGVAVSMDQIFLAAHQSYSSYLDQNDSTMGDHGSLVLAADNVRSHFLLNENGLMQARALLYEITLYEVTNFVKDKSQSGKHNESIAGRCKQLRQRCGRSQSSVASPILHRSKLGLPLSPETPSFAFDLLSTYGDDDDDDDDEKSIHLTVYNMTYRLSLGETWTERLASLLERRGGENRISDQEDDSKDASDDAAQSLLRIFVSLADCSFDYTSPTKFKTASRMLLRVGEIRLTSNMLTPPGPTQSFKFSLTDLSLHLVNTRHPYNYENSRLSWASRILHPDDLVTERSTAKWHTRAQEYILPILHFITIVTLESMSATVMISGGENGKDPVLKLDEFSRSKKPKSTPPKVAVAVSFGKLNLYSCKDSLACLVDTFSELQLEMISMTDEQIEALKAKCVEATTKNKITDCAEFLPSVETDIETEDPWADAFEDDEIDKIHGENQLEDDTESPPNNNNDQVPDSELSASELRKRHGIGNSAADHAADSLLGKHYYTVDTGLGEQPAKAEGRSESAKSFAEDHDWTTIEHEWSRESNVPQGEEQASRWIPSEGEADNNVTPQLRIFPHHIPMIHMSDPFSVDDMNAAKYARTSESPLVDLRIIVLDMTLNCRFFDGYDWLQKKLVEVQKKSSLEIAAHQHSFARKRAGTEDGAHEEFTRRKDELMGTLLGLDEPPMPQQTSAFKDLPLPEEKTVQLKVKAEERRLARRTNRFFQVSASGVKFRVDTFAECSEHRLASCVDLSLGDLFVSETLSNPKPIKMLGEWVNEIEHPRDSSDGLVMFKMVSWRPEWRVSADGKVMGDESRASLRLLPLRFFLDQGSIRSIRSFFGADDDETDDTKKDENDDSSNISVKDAEEDKPYAEPFIKSLKVHPCKLKVNYQPVKVDVDALRDGSLVELVNICPLEDMVLTLDKVDIRNLTGWGPVLGELTSLWIEDILATQLYKFVANAVPFQAIASVGGDAADLVVLPWEAFKEEGDVIHAVRTGTSHFVGTLAYETLNLTSKLTKFAASQVAAALQRGGMPTLPSRPDVVPKGVGDTARHSIESMSRGLQTANYKIVIVPYREYRRTGTAGAAKSIAKGIPVAIMAPLGGASEALSYTLLGARNQVRPSIRKEEEAARRGLLPDF